MADEIKKTFETPEGCDLVVKNVLGSIVVKGWDRPETEVIAVRHHEQTEVEIRQEGRQILVKTKTENGWGDFFHWLSKGRPPSVDYTIQVPHTSNLKVSNVSGPIQIAQVKGQIQANNVDGPTTLETVAGEISAETVNGSIKASGLDGQAKLKAVNGAVKARGGRLEGLTAETVNGEVKLGMALAPGKNYAIHTVNGSCHLALPPTALARVSAHGINSGVDCTLASRDVHRSLGSWTGVVGTGDGPMAEITFYTVNGRLHLDSGEPAAEAFEPVPPVPPTSPTPPVPPAQPIVVKVAEPEPKEEPAEHKPQSRSEVLQRLERGEITVDQALELLKSLPPE